MSNKNTIYFITSVILLLSNLIPAQQTDSLYNFFKMLSKYGWELSEFNKELPEYVGIEIIGGQIKYNIPDKGGYYAKLNFYILSYTSASQVPLSNREFDQVYPSSFSDGTFPIEKYKDLFEGVYNWEHYEYIRWNAYRRQNRICLIYANPARQDIDYVFSLLVSYNQAKADSIRNNIESGLFENYSFSKETFESYKIIQEALKKMGIYAGKVDGIFGGESVKALQKFLKSNGLYQGAIDGEIGKSTKAAIKKLQEEAEIKTTGEININTAKEIKRRLH